MGLKGLGARGVAVWAMLSSMIWAYTSSRQMKALIFIVQNDADHFEVLFTHLEGIADAEESGKSG